MWQYPATETKMLNLKIKSNNLKLKSFYQVRLGFKFLVVIFTFSFLIFSSGQKASAQSVSLSIYPPLLEVMIQPGKSFIGAYEITNNSDIDLYLRPIVVPFEPAGQKGGVKLQTTSHQPPATSYFSLTNADIQLNQTFKLPANSQQQLVLKINVPKGQLEKDHYFTFLVEQTPEGKFVGSPETATNLIKIGGNILLTISQSGLPKKQGVIAKFISRPKIADLLETVKFKVLIQNTGDAFFKTNGQIDIYHRLTKKKMANLNFRPDNVLVDSAREIVCSESCAFSSLLPGPYRAIVSFTPDESNNQEAAVALFWILPIKSGLVIILLILLIWQIKRKIKKKS